MEAPEEIVRNLAAIPNPGLVTCIFGPCRRNSESGSHAPDCPWRQAVEYVERFPKSLSRDLIEGAARQIEERALRENPKHGNYAVWDDTH